MSINKQSCPNPISLYREAQNTKDCRERTLIASLATANRLNVAIPAHHGNRAAGSAVLSPGGGGEASRQGRSYSVRLCAGFPNMNLGIGNLRELEINFEVIPL